MKNSPWGKIQYTTAIAQGVLHVDTSSHGGIKVDRKFNALMPDYLRREGGWYEEDCEWCLPFVALEEHFLCTGTPKIIEIIKQEEHRRIFVSYYWSEYERFYRVILQPGESRGKAEEVWKEAHKADWQCVTAYGDWHPRVPTGMVGRACTVGGKSDGERRVFLLSAEEDHRRGSERFIPDLSRHQEISSGDM